MIGRLHHVVIDCPEPLALAEFYAELTGLRLSYVSDDWVVIATAEDTSGLAFQRAPDLLPARWPDPVRPQQFHLDIMVDDLPSAVPKVTELGGRPLPSEDEGCVFEDPAGHPFCLVSRPPWAAPIHPT